MASFSLANLMASLLLSVACVTLLAFSSISLSLFIISFSAFSTALRPYFFIADCAPLVKTALPIIDNTGINGTGIFLFLSL